MLNFYKNLVKIDMLLFHKWNLQIITYFYSISIIYAETKYVIVDGLCYISCEACLNFKLQFLIIIIAGTYL